MALAFALSCGMIAGWFPAAAAAAPVPSASGSRTVAAEKAEADPPALSEAEALSQAKLSGQDVEVVSLRGESSETFATPEGSLEAREYLRPVWTREAGEWRPIDTDLARSADGGMIRPGATTVGLSFSGGGDGPLVRMERAGRTLALSWPLGDVPAPVVDGETATYPEILPDVDLRLGAQEDGFSQLLVVKSAEAAGNEALEELRLALATEGMHVRTTDSGGLEAVDAGAAGTVFEAATPVMWDSSAAPAGEGRQSRVREQREGWMPRRRNPVLESPGSSQP
ncbi:hypothetical protein [Streptomyces sp. NBC_01498]|uniref:hypothetical protein n=1 Tax=Streptomyces sp. NBC_01498 TaxID=2975870 RepID=UPI002E7B85F6|nr:hypothetical protein [Streptomyces sp. NBC_01498]